MPNFARFNIFASNTTVNESSRTVRPPTYFSHDPPPTYMDRSAVSARERNERVNEWNTTTSSASGTSPADHGSVLDIAPSSVRDTDSVGASTEGRPAGPRYIYYRVYTEDGAIPSANPVYTDDLYLGRISADLVAPPLTAVNLKCCLSAVENIDENATTNLFVSASSQTPMNDGCRVSIFKYPGPGCRPNEPMALVVKGSGVGQIPSDGSKEEEDHVLPQEGLSPFETQYLFYRMYKSRGAVKSKKSVDSSDPWVGRISVDSVPPPHSVASIMRCVSKAEELENSKHSQLWINSSSESPLGPGHVSILGSNRPGSTPEDAMAFVELDTAPTPGSNPSIEKTPFTRQMRVIATSAHTKQNRGWLRIKKGEILHTTSDKPRQRQYNWYDDTCHSPAYKAINSAGRVGYVSVDCVEPC